MSDVQHLIEQLALEPHPEGGWYRETWRAVAKDGERASGTAIYFLLEHGQKSHWHTVDAAELWLWHAGSSLKLKIAEDHASNPTEIRLGADFAAGEVAQHIIPPSHWQAAETDRGWALVSCVVVPGFDFAGFTLAPKDWTPG